MGEEIKENFVVEIMRFWLRISEANLKRSTRILGKILKITLVEDNLVNQYLRGFLEILLVKKILKIFF